MRTQMMGFVDYLVIFHLMVVCRTVVNLSLGLSRPFFVNFFLGNFAVVERKEIKVATSWHYSMR